MKDKNLFQILLSLNIALAIAFVLYLLVSNQGDPKVKSIAFSGQESEIIDGSLASQLKASPSVSLVSNSIEARVETTAPTNSLLKSHSAPESLPIHSSKTFGWADVEMPVYQSYVDSLRLVGCPEDKIRHIILSDINELFSQKRLKESKEHDQPWWQTKHELSMSQFLREKGLELNAERIELIRQWLGEDVAEAEQGESAFWNHVPLTGPVLGALNNDKHQLVQEICAESIDRYQSIFWSSVNDGRPINKLDLAKLRERTRSELAKELNESQVQEFLLRYSHNAENLRQEFRGFNPTPGEFRAVFQAIDQLEHNMQLQFGGTEFLSAQQKARHERLRDQAIKEALSPERFQAYLMTKDPIYKQAQSMAMQYGAPSSAVMEIYELAKENEVKKQEIISNQSLTSQDRNMALQTIYAEQRKKAREIALRSSPTRN